MNMLSILSILNDNPSESIVESIEIIIDSAKKYKKSIEDMAKAKNEAYQQTIKQYSIQSYNLSNAYESSMKTYGNPDKEYKDFIRRLINVSPYKKYIINNYVFNNFDSSINESSKISLNKLIIDLDTISKMDYNKYNELVNHLKNIKFRKLAIKDKTQIFEEEMDTYRKNLEASLNAKSGGNNKQYKEILGKRRRIYKIKGSRKEHIKYKGELIPVSEYKKLFKK